MSFPVLYFAAGLGTRMGVLTKNRPKPLVSVGGRALIDYALDLGDAAGLQPQVINLHYKAQMIRDHLSGRGLAFSDESDALLETGGGLRHAASLLGQGPVITMNTDAVWGKSNPFEVLKQAWDPSRMEALLLVLPPNRARGHKGAGDFLMADDGALRRGPQVIYAGAQIIAPETLDVIPEARFSLNVVWDVLIAKGTLFGVQYPDDWCDVGQPESIPIAEALIAEGQ